MTTLHRLLALSCAVIAPFGAAFANHIPLALDIPGFRTAMLGEGYLEFKINPLTNTFGDEYTGWIDVRHPAGDDSTDTVLGHDRSDHFFNVRTTTVSDQNNVSAAPQIGRDYTFANRIYAQIGLSAVRTESGTLKMDGTGGTVATTWPMNQGAQDDNMKSLSRSGNALTINSYYVKIYDGSAPNGLASPPAGFGNNVPRNDGIGIADQAVTSTYAHELGHMLLNGPSLHNQTPATPSESDDPQNFMFKTGVTYGFNDVTLTNGKIEDAQGQRIFANGGNFNPGFVQKQRDPLAADRVDWDFAADNIKIERGIPNADNFVAEDRLYFGIGTTVAPSHFGEVHTGLGEFGATPDYVGAFFTTADVFSLGLRYGDYDGNPAPTQRESTLDYNLFFVNAFGGETAGTPVTVFTGGWSGTTFADDYLARWQAPLGFQAVGVFIEAVSGNGHDGNAQIDAVIVSNLPPIPEPGTASLAAAGALLLAGRRRRSIG